MSTSVTKPEDDYTIEVEQFISWQQWPVSSNKLYPYIQNNIFIISHRYITRLKQKYIFLKYTFYFPKIQKDNKNRTLRKWESNRMKNRIESNHGKINKTCTSHLRIYCIHLIYTIFYRVFHVCLIPHKQSIE